MHLIGLIQLQNGEPPKLHIWGNVEERYAYIRLVNRHGDPRTAREIALREMLRLLRGGWQLCQTSSSTLLLNYYFCGASQALAANHGRR